MLELPATLSSIRRLDFQQAHADIVQQLQLQLLHRYKYIHIYISVPLLLTLVRMRPDADYHRYVEFYGKQRHIRATLQQQQLRRLEVQKDSMDRGTDPGS